MSGWRDLSDEELEARLRQRGDAGASDLVAMRDDPQSAGIIDRLLED